MTKKKETLLSTYYRRRATRAGRLLARAYSRIEHGLFEPTLAQEISAFLGYLLEEQKYNCPDD